MLLVRDVMSYAFASLTHVATVRNGVELLRERPSDQVFILRDGTVVGILDPLRLSLYEGEVSVMEAMQEPPFVLDVNTPLSEATLLMRAHRLRQAPVMEKDRLVGVLSDRDLLSVWGEPNDGLTLLPVQHRLRRWLSMELAAGKEAVVLFLDLNNFGQLNKIRGHVYGDRVLQAVANVLRESAVRQQDFACRYGGDEFAIGTIRSLESAHELAREIRDRVANIHVDGAPAELRVAIGIAGGRRVQPRVGTHPDATLDDLLTTASRASTAAKRSRESIACAPGPGGKEPEAWEYVERVETQPVGRPPVDGYSVVENNGEVEVTVRLGAGQEVIARTCRASANGLTRAVASATAQCLRAYARTGHDVLVEETYEFTTPRGILCVGATVVLTREDGTTERLVGTAPVLGDVCRTYINAVLDATNRRMLRSHVPQLSPPLQVTVS